MSSVLLILFDHRLCVLTMHENYLSGVRGRVMPGVDWKVTGRRCHEWEVEGLFEEKLGRKDLAVRQVLGGGGK